MIVEYKGSTNGWLSAGCRCPVLEVFINGQKPTMYRVYSEKQKTPYLEDSSMFALIDGDLPRDWSLWTDGNGAFSITYKKWQVNGFWEAYFDGKEWAIKLFNDMILA